MSAEFRVKLSKLYKIATLGSGRHGASVPSGQEPYPIIQQWTFELLCWNQDGTPDPNSSIWYRREAS